jgi:hypothetical protein
VESASFRENDASFQTYTAEVVQMELALRKLTGPRTRMITTPKMAYSMGCIM